MIYILTGVAKSGKTYIANKIVNKFHIPYFSTDYLMMSLSLSTIDTGVHHEEDDKIVARQLEPFLYPMIRAMVENKINYLIEGVHFNPLFAKKLLNDFEGKIQVVYLGYTMSDTKAKVSEIRSHINSFENPWFKDFSDTEMNKVIQYLIDVSKTIQNEVKLLQIPYIEVYNIEEQSSEIISKLIRDSY